jgi:hypothetical protein
MYKFSKITVIKIGFRTRIGRPWMLFRLGQKNYAESDLVRIHNTGTKTKKQQVVFSAGRNLEM